jgi:UDP-N-acetylmuramate: L-alanyl-gamma-D-glutamyl-meso-diaminopimelate ligase
MTDRLPDTYHFIAIGGAAMHNLALALHEKGCTVTGSDDEINEPSRSRLAAAGLLPDTIGWFPEKIHSGLDAVILGMHARADNPELKEAERLGIPVYSYPEFLYEQSKEKQRVVIGGSHGKTTITSMILHVLRRCGCDFDYMVGAKLEGFDTMVRLSDAPVIILEGDEYLSSPIDRRPKFHLYRADIGVISGIAWDHINVFPTFEDYVLQFRVFADAIPAEGSLIFCQEDPEVAEVAGSSASDARRIPYGVPSHRIADGITYLTTPAGEVPLKVFGKHNLMNLEAARRVCNLLGVSNADFYESISTFNGAARRLEPLGRNSRAAVFKDFAHSPSKLRATTEAVRSQYPSRRLIACMELHTFSSLNDRFLDEYAGSMDGADVAMVYFNPRTIAHKRLPDISVERVAAAFGHPDVQVFTDSSRMLAALMEMDFNESVLLLMSSGNFDGLVLEEVARQVLQKTMLSV